MVKVNLDKINKMLEDNNFTQDRLSEILTWKQPTVSAKLNGNRKLKIEELYVISILLDTTMEELLEIDNI